jgi:molecular chaperone Hsp33
LRFFAVNAIEVVKKAASVHQLSSIETVILGQTLAASMLLALDLKHSNDAVTIKIDSDGICSGVLVTAKSDGSVKGFIKSPKSDKNSNDENKMVSVKEALGKGQLTIIKDSGLKQPYVGVVELRYGEIAKDMTYYFAQSEQIPTSIGLGVLLDESGNVRQAGGFMIQLLPETPADFMLQIENLVSHFPNLTDLLDMGMEIDEIVKKILLKDIPLKILQEKPVAFSCDCTKDKFARGLQLLEAEELNDMINNEEEVEIVCQFCNQKYFYSEMDISKILIKKMNKDK